MARRSVLVLGFCVLASAAQGAGDIAVDMAMISNGDLRVFGGGEGDVTDWIIPEIGWDEASFDGLRTLQAAAGLRPAPPRRELLAARRQDRRARAHQELAERLGMPWRPEYTHDEAAFQAEFDRVRRVLGGKEEPREGDPTP